MISFYLRSMDTENSLCCGKQIKILVVDDDADNLILLTYQLSQFLNCTVLSATDGNSALELVDRESPNLILLDVMMPDLDGLEVARRLKGNLNTATIPLIAVTAMARVQDQEMAIAAGFDDFLRKPYEIETLIATIRRFLRIPCFS